MALPTSSYLNNLKIAQFADALYATAVGSTTNGAVLADVAANGLNATLNSYYTYTFTNQGVSAASVAATVVANLGVTVASVGSQANVDAVTNYVLAAINAAPGAEGAAISNVLTTWAGLTSNATYGSVVTAWNAAVSGAQAYTASGATADQAITSGSGITYNLGTAVDNITGTSQNDTFNAPILNNSNTLQSGDTLDGGAGVNTLNADIGNSQAFAITPNLTNIQNVNIRAEANAVDTNNNNMYSANAAAATVQIDAQNTAGVTNWTDSNSRADVLVEDVRIKPTQITKDITISMVQTDPGNVDYGVYFDQLSLRNASSSNSSLTVQVMDTASAANAATSATPLLNFPYDTFKFNVTANGATNLVTLTLPNAAAADNYAQLLAAFQQAIANNPATAGVVTAALSGTFTVTDPVSQAQVTGQNIILSTTGNASVSVDPVGTANPTTGWVNSKGTPVTGASNIYTNLNSGGSSTTELVTSKIVLDDVGRGSTGGDLVVGGMSVGDTSTSRGVERFEIDVKNNSKLQTINSTNNALKEVVITSNSDTTSPPSDANNNSAYTTTKTGAGDLTVNGNVNLTSQTGITQGTATLANVGSDTILPGVNSSNTINGYAADHHGAYGFTDVRLIDASAFKGNLAFTAQITPDSIAKYVNAVDTQANPAADVAGAGNVNFNVKGANFAYTGGSGNDTMVVAIDPTVAASRSTVVSGLSDFTFNINGGAGDDNITVSIANTLKGGTTNQNWYNNQNLNDNISISGGDGNDTIRKPGAGDANIDGGAGNDTIYADNTGAQAIVTTAGSPLSASGMGTWVFNTADKTAVSTNINDLRSDVNNSYNLFGATLQVTFKGIPSAAITLSNTTTRTMTDLEVNQAIKNAINTDATLSKLLVATDGPANTLVVTSLIDGTQVAGNLAVTLSAPTNTLSTADLAAVNAAWGTTYADSATALAAEAAVVTAFNTKADYASTFATDGAAASIVGANSTATSDNFITPGSGNDVVVLGTTVGADLNSSSNDTVIYAAGFGNDVVVNFAATGNGIDHLDFSSFLGTTSGTVGAVGTASGVVTIAATATGVNDSATAVAALYPKLAAGAANTTDVYVSYDAHNVGSVYSITNTSNGATATLQGTIDLADTAWSTITSANVTVPSHIAEATAGATAPTGGGTGGGGTGTGQTFNIAAAGTTVNPATNDTFNIAAGNYAATINGFNAGDKIVAFAGASINIVANTNTTDGQVQYTFNDPATGSTATITITGLTTAQDAAIFNVPSFNTLFGAGSLA